MDKVTEITDVIPLKEGEAHQVWHIADELPERKLITQSSAYCFNEEGKFAIIKNKDGYWAIPGGHLEEYEHPKDTVIREVLEEACVEIENPELCGYQEIDMPDGSKIYQLRWAAKVKNVLEFKADWESEEVRFVDPVEVGEYISWWSKSAGGKAELTEAMKKLGIGDKVSSK